MTLRDPASAHAGTDPTVALPPQPSPHRKHNLQPRRQRAAFYRLMRDLHAWLSALAFLLLIFFAATGLTLNHPDWFEHRQPESPTATFVLPPPVLARITADLASGRSPVNQVLDQVPDQLQLRGLFKSSEHLDDELLIRLEGVQGNSDLTVRLDSGEVALAISPATPIGTLNDLHRGKNVATPWRWLIDVSAIVILLLSLVGYVLFFGLKKRLSTSLLLTVLSLGLIGAMAWSSLG